MRSTSTSELTSGQVPRAREPGREGFRWRDVGLSALLTLVAAVPTMALEEDWHGRPMIEQTTDLWIVAAVLVVAAFVIGGVAAGYRRPHAALLHAVAASATAVTVLLVAALSRRVWVVHEGTPHAVVKLWCLGTVGAVALSAIGSQVGKRLAPR